MVTKRQQTRIPRERKKDKKQKTKKGRGKAGGKRSWRIGDIVERGNVSADDREEGRA